MHYWVVTLQADHLPIVCGDWLPLRVAQSKTLRLSRHDGRKQRRNTGLGCFKRAEHQQIIRHAGSRRSERCSRTEPQTVQQGRPILSFAASHLPGQYQRSTIGLPEARFWIGRNRVGKVAAQRKLSIAMTSTHPDEQDEGTLAKISRFGISGPGR